MSIQTTQSGSSAYGTFGTECGGGAYNYSAVTDDPASLTDWSETVEPDLGSFSADLYFADTVDGWWIRELSFICLRGTISYGFFDTQGLSYSIIAHIGDNTIEQSASSFGLAGGVQTITIEINDFVSITDHIEFSVSCFYKPRMRTGVGFNRGWEFRDGGGPGPAFHLTNSTWPSGCSGSGWDGSDIYPWHEFTYDSSIVQASNGMGYASSSGSASAPSGNASSDSWSESQSSGATFHTAEALRFAHSGTYSSVYRVDNYTKTCVIGTITGSGQLDVLVSNDGTNFVIYDSLTSDGYIECQGFRYVKLYVDSGEVGSATLASQRRIDRISIETQTHRDSVRLGRIMSTRRGWGKGDM